MFIFINSNYSEINDLQWNYFLNDLYNQISNYFKTEIPIKLFESILIQEIYIHYLLNIQSKLYYGFNYEINPIQITNENFWKVCTVQYEDCIYYYHKITNLLFIKNAKQFIWIGIYDKQNDSIIYRNNCNKYIEEWVINCGFI